MIEFEAKLNRKDVDPVVIDRSLTVRLKANYHDHEMVMTVIVIGVSVDILYIEML